MNKFGTVEPVFRRNEKDKTGRILSGRNLWIVGFVRGLVSKYQNQDVDIKEVFEYLDKLVNYPLKD